MSCFLDFGEKYNFLFRTENLKKTDKFESVMEFTSSYGIYFFKSAVLFIRYWEYVVEHGIAKSDQTYTGAL